MESPSPLPRHIAFILDGNRRWAREHGLPVAMGYQRGGERVWDLVSQCEQAGIEFVTLWPLSISNLSRDASELAPLLSVITAVITRLASARRWRLRLIGNADAVPPDMARRWAAAAADTDDIGGMTVNLAIAYDGRDEIVRAVRRMIADHQNTGTLDRLADGLSAENLAGYLDTAGQPDPDLIIRTSGEQRLSGMLSWQAGSAELYFCDTLWPAFTHADLQRALDAYGSRERRFGY